MNFEANILKQTWEINCKKW